MKRTFYIILAILASMLILFSIFFINNQSKLKQEANLIHSYGERVKVSNGDMNITISGSGDKTIVLLPGFMTAAPTLDFKVLTDKLEKDYRIVVVEPLGYGMSDDTDVERTVDNMTSELHQALNKLNIHKFSLLAHSISGVYSLDYIQKYPNEVESFIGIDSSLPSQGDAENNGEKAVRFFSKSGLIRPIIAFKPEMMNLPPLSEELQEQFRYIFFRSIGSNAMTSEGGLMPKNFDATIELKYPKELPVLYLLSSESTSPDETWLNLHKDIIKDKENAELKILKGGHYLHHTQSDAIAKDIKEFLADY